jgi:hypothetical protein
MGVRIFSGNLEEANLAGIKIAVLFCSIFMPSSLDEPIILYKLS